MTPGKRSAVRIRLKGVNRVRKRLASGDMRTYYYAWKGGPRLEGEPGSPEFHASYIAAGARISRLPADQLASVIDEYRHSSEFSALAERTRKDYNKLLLKIEEEFGDFPLSALGDRRTRGEFMAWRDRNALRSRRQADYAYAVLARVLSWSHNRGITAINPCERGGRVYRASRSDRVWAKTDEEAFYASAPTHLHLALALALWTGQRQGDLLRLTWTAYDGKTIRLRQGKTGAAVKIPVGTDLAAKLDKERERQTALTTSAIARPVLVTIGGQAWTEGGFRASWRKGCDAAGIKGLTFHDLRGTAVTRLAQAGCTVPEIATITGHSLKDVGSILDSHYLNRDDGLARNAIQKLEVSQML